MTCSVCEGRACVTVPVGIDACMACAFQAEIEWQVMQDVRRDIASMNADEADKE